MVPSPTRPSSPSARLKYLSDNALHTQPREHRAKAERLRGSLAKLDDKADYEMVIEVCFAAGVQYLACIAETRTGRHHDSHKGLARFLAEAGLSDLVEPFHELDSLRTSRFYGGQRDGRAARRAREVLDAIERLLH